MMKDHEYEEIFPYLIPNISARLMLIEKEFIIMLVFDDVLVLAANIWLASSKMCGCLTSQLQISSIFDISANDDGKDTSHGIVKFPSICNGGVASDALLSVRSGL